MVARTRERSGETLDSWLEFDSGGGVTVYTGKVELGTGVRTALAQLVAEELDLPRELVSLIMGDTRLTPDEGGTTGSKTLQTAGARLQQVAAEARRVLLTRAASCLGVPVDALQIENGVVFVSADPARSVPFAGLIAEPFSQPVSGRAPLKPAACHTVVGTSAPRVDLLAKLTGGESFVHDLRLDGMVHGRVLRPHVRTLNGAGGATVVSIDDAAVRDLPGIVAVVRNGNFVGVVAERGAGDSRRGSPAPDLDDPGAAAGAGAAVRPDDGDAERAGGSRPPR